MRPNQVRIFFTCRTGFWSKVTDICWESSDLEEGGWAMFQHFYMNFYSNYLSGIVWIMGEWEIMETYPYMPSCHIYDRIVQVNCRNVQINCRIVLKFSRFLCMENSLHFREALILAQAADRVASFCFVVFCFGFGLSSQRAGFLVEILSHPVRSSKVLYCKLKLRGKLWIRCLFLFLICQGMN